MWTVYSYRADHAGTYVLHSVRTFKLEASAELYAHGMRNAGFLAEVYA